MKSDTPAILCMGEILIDMVAEPKGCGLAGAKHFLPLPGGAPANVSVGLARLGVPTAFIGMVGKDAFGDILRSTLESNQVLVSNLCVSNAQPTTLAFVALSEAGVPDFAFYRSPGADLSITQDDVDWSLFKTAKGFHFGSLSLVSDPAYSTTMACLEEAIKQGMTISYDPNYRPALWKDEAEACQKMMEPLSYVNILKVSEEELYLLSNNNQLEAGCACLAAKGPKLILVTKGEMGMTLWYKGQLIDVPARTIDVVDTTGCGDASVAGFLYWLYQSEEYGQHEYSTVTLEWALNYANHCASITAMQPGAITALPYLEEASQSITQTQE